MCWFQDIRVSNASRRRREDSEIWRASRRMDAGQSIADVALFFFVHYSVISRLWKQFLSSQTIVWRHVTGRQSVTTSADNRYIAVAAKQNRRATSTCVTSMVAASICKTISSLLYAKCYTLNDGTSGSLEFVFLYLYKPKDCNGNGNM